MNNIKSALALLALLAVAAPAAAQEKAIYLGGSLGYGQYKSTCKRLLVPCDDQDTAWRGFAGYQFNRHLAAELGYGDLGEVTGNGLLPSGAATYKLNSKAWDLSALASIPIAGRLDALVRLGMYRARTTEDQEGGFGTLRAGATNSGLTYGAGLGYTLGIIGLRADWQRYDNVGGSAIVAGEDDIDVFSFGVLVRF